MRDFGNRFDVADDHRRVGGRLDVDESRFWIRFERGVPRIGREIILPDDVDVEARQDVGEELIGGVVK